MARLRRVVGRSNIRLRKSLRRNTPRISSTARRKPRARKFLRKVSTSTRRTVKRFKPRR